MGKKITGHNIKPNTIFVMEFSEDEAIVCILRDSPQGKKRWDLLERLLEGEKFPYLDRQNDRYDIREHFCQYNGREISLFRTLTQAEKNDWKHIIEVAMLRCRPDDKNKQELESLIELLA